MEQSTRLRSRRVGSVEQKGVHVRAGSEIKERKQGE